MKKSLSFSGTGIPGNPINQPWPDSILREIYEVFATLLCWKFPLLKSDCYLSLSSKQLRDCVNLLFTKRSRMNARNLNIAKLFALCNYMVFFRFFFDCLVIQGDSEFNWLATKTQLTFSFSFYHVEKNDLHHY